MYYIYSIDEHLFGFLSVVEYFLIAGIDSSSSPSLRRTCHIDVPGFHLNSFASSSSSS